MNPLRELRSAATLTLLAAALPAQVKLHTKAAGKLVSAEAAIQRLATGLKATCGPVWVERDQALIFADPGSGRQLFWSAGGGVEDWWGRGVVGAATMDTAGAVLFCRRDTRDVVRILQPGMQQSLRKLADRPDPFLGPQDVAVRKDGSVWFTDAGAGEGAVYRCDPMFERSVWMEPVSADLEQPSGICFAPGHERFYIADAGQPQRIGAFDLEEDDTLSAARMWMDGGATGMCCDRDGNLYAACRDGVRIFSPSGVKLATVALPEPPTDCAFGGKSGKQLFVTAGGSLYRVPMKKVGAPVPGAWEERRVKQDPYFLVRESKRPVQKKSKQR